MCDRGAVRERVGCHVLGVTRMFWSADIAAISSLVKDALSKDAKPQDVFSVVVADQSKQDT